MVIKYACLYEVTCVAACMCWLCATVQNLPKLTVTNAQARYTRRADNSHLNRIVMNSKLATTSGDESSNLGSLPAKLRCLSPSIEGEFQSTPPPTPTTHGEAEAAAKAVALLPIRSPLKSSHSLEHNNSKTIIKQSSVQQKKKTKQNI